MKEQHSSDIISNVTHLWRFRFQCGCGGLDLNWSQLHLNLFFGEHSCFVYQQTWTYLKRNRYRNPKWEPNKANMHKDKIDTGDADLDQSLRNWFQWNKPGSQDSEDMWSLVNAGKIDELKKAMKKRLVFGTAGIRGKMGIGWAYLKKDLKRRFYFVSNVWIAGLAASMTWWLSKRPKVWPITPCKPTKVPMS